MPSKREWQERAEKAEAELTLLRLDLAAAERELAMHRSVRLPWPPAAPLLPWWQQTGVKPYTISNSNKVLAST